MPCCAISRCTARSSPPCLSHAWPSCLVSCCPTCRRSAGYAFADNAFMQWVDTKIGKRVGDFLRSFAGMIRTWMLRNGLGAKTMTVDDFVGYAMAGLDRAAAGEVRGRSATVSASQGQDEQFRETERGNNGSLDPGNDNINFSRSVGDAPAQEAQRVQSAIEGRTLIEAAQFLTRSKDGAKAAVAQKVLEKLQRLEKAGVALDLKVVHRGDMAPASMVNARGYTETGFDAKGRDIVVWLNGADVLDSYLKGARPGEQELAVMVPVHVVARAVAALRSVQVPVTEEWSAQRDNALVPAAGRIYPAKSREDAERFVRENPKYEVRRRTPMVPAGPWEPLPSPGTTTEEE